MAQIRQIYQPSPRDPRHFVPAIDDIGEFIRIPKRELYLDKSYQRDRIIQRAVRRIAYHWSWIACGALSVSQREEDDKYYIYDGGHRWSAAMTLPEINELPCLVFRMPDAKSEAVGFLAANVERHSISRIHAHKAELKSGSPRALLVDELAREAGRTIGAPADKTHISCVSALERCAAQDATALQRIWPVIIELCRDQPLPSMFVQGLWATERRMPYGQSLTDERWRSRLLRSGPVNLERDMRNAIAISGARSEKALAQGVEMTLNRGLRGVKLELQATARRGEFRV